MKIESDASSPPADPTHPTADRLTAFAQGRLSDLDIASIGAHLAQCETCCQTLQQTAAGDALESRMRRAHGGTGESVDERRPLVDALGNRFAGLPPAGAESDDVTGNSSALSGPRLDFLSPSTESDQLGRMGHYAVLSVVGEGGMGIVLKARDEVLHRVIALKVMAPQLASNGAARKRFQREAQAAAAVSHEHVVTIHAVEEFNGLPCIAMQCIHGISLQDKIDREGPLELIKVLRIGLQTAEGLAAAHKQGLVHRDIKPANILLDNGIENVKITDFGLARAAADASITQSGIVAGTPMYMSPEQAASAPIDARSDLFSLGSVLYSMCTGRPPFRADGPLAVLKRVAEDTPRPIAEMNPEIPDWLSALIARLHAKDPNERYQTADEVAELLSWHLAQLQQPGNSRLAPAERNVVRISQRGAADLRLGRRRWRAVAVGVGLIAIGVVGTLLVRHYLPGDPPTSVPAGAAGTPAVPVAADALKRADIAPELLSAAGGGDPAKSPPELVAILKGHEGQVSAVAISADGTRLASGGADKTIRLWDLAGGKLLHTLEGHTAEINRIAFSPDGKRLASGARDRTGRIWDVANGVQLHAMHHRWYVYSVAFSPDGETLACGTVHEVTFHDVTSGARLPGPFEMPGNAWIFGLAYSRDGRLATAGHSDRQIRLWDLTARTAALTFPAAAADVDCLVMTPDTRQLLTVGSGGLVMRWELPSCMPLPPLRGPKGKLRTVTLRPDGTVAAACGDEGTVWLWDLQVDPPRLTGFELFPAASRPTGERISTGGVHDIAFTPEGRHLATANPDGTVYVLRLAAGP